MFPNDLSQDLKEKYCNVRNGVRIDLKSGKNLEDSIAENLSRFEGLEPEVYSRMVDCLIATDFEELDPRYDSNCFGSKNSYARTSENFNLAEDF